MTAEERVAVEAERDSTRSKRGIKSMNNKAFIVVFSGPYPEKRVSVPVMATDKNEARCAAIEHAKKEGQAVGECLRVVLA